MLTMPELELLIHPVRERVRYTTSSCYFTDRAAVHILEALNLVLPDRNIPSKHFVSTNLSETLWFDMQISTFFQRYPTGQGVEVAGGLSSRFHRLSELSDWPRFSWQMIDSPSVDDCLEHVYPSTDNFSHSASEAPLIEWPLFVELKKTNAVIVLLGEQHPLTREEVHAQIENTLKTIEPTSINCVRILLRHTCGTLAQKGALNGKVRVINEVSHVKNLPLLARVWAGMTGSMNTYRTYLTHLALNQTK